MALKTYSGSCHCGAVRFQAELDLAAGMTRCNCSLCSKVRSWFVVASRERVRLIAGADAQTEYQWAPPGGRSFLHYRFCKTCGIRTFGMGGEETDAGGFWFVNVAALDGVSIDELADAPLRYVDGRNDRYDQPPEDTRLM